MGSWINFSIVGHTHQTKAKKLAEDAKAKAEKAKKEAQVRFSAPNLVLFVASLCVCVFTFESPRDQSHVNRS